MHHNYRTEVTELELKLLLGSVPNYPAFNLVPRLPPPTGNECAKFSRIHFWWEEGAGLGTGTSLTCL